MDAEGWSSGSATVQDRNGEDSWSELGMRDRAIGGMRRLMGNLRRPGGRSWNVKEEIEKEGGEQILPPMERVEVAGSVMTSEQWAEM